MQLVIGRSSDLLPFCRPSRIKTVASHGQKVWCGDYSSGNCSGFTPDSLLAFQTKNQNHDANV